MPPKVDISKFTDEQKRLFSQAASLGSGVEVTNNGVTQTIAAPTAITPSSITSTENPYKAPAYTPPPVPDTSGFADLMARIGQPTQAQTEALNTRSSIAQSIQDTVNRMLGQGERKAELETEKGVYDKQKALNETIAQMRFNDAGAFGASQAQEDRLAPTFAIQGTQAQIERQRAVKNFSLAAVAAVQQDNLALAQDQVQKALDAEFKPLETILEAQKFFLEQNGEDIKRADKQAYDEANIVLAERERMLNEAKDNRNAVYTLVAEAAKNRAPSSVVNMALNAKSPSEAINILSRYLSDPDAQAKAAAELEQTRAQTQLLYANIDKTIAEKAKIYTDALSPKPVEAKEYQYKANLFAGRTSDADQTISSLENSISSMSPAVYAAQASIENSTIGNSMVSSEFQQLRQAERNFLNAVLRRESGAVIAPSEFAEGARQYFPRPGDSPETLALKKQNRTRVTESLKFEAGPAYTPLVQPQTTKSTSISPAEAIYESVIGTTAQSTLNSIDQSGVGNWINRLFIGY